MLVVLVVHLTAQAFQYFVASSLVNRWP